MVMLKKRAQGNKYYRPALNGETLALMTGQGNMAEGMNDHYMGIKSFWFLAMREHLHCHFLLGGIIAVGTGIPPPCLRSIISKQVESSELGNSFYYFLWKNFFFPVENYWENIDPNGFYVKSSILIQYCTCW